MANVIFNNAKKLKNDGTIQWNNGAHTYRALLTTSSYTPDIDAHLYVSSITNELAGGSYVRKDIAGRTVTVDNANDRADCKGDNLAYTGLTNGQTAAKAVIYKFGTTDADSPLIACVDINSGAGVVMTGDVNIKWDNQASNGRIYSDT